MLPVGKNKFLKRLDWYIIKKFLGTYVFAIALIISIAVVFDFNEKMDRFMSHEAPWQAIIFDYYMNFIPYFANLFSPLFVFIAVIFFTSKLAENSEIIAMFSTGMSFKRMLRPYMVSAAIIAITTFCIGTYWVAFERSACRLCGLFPKSELSLFCVPDCPEYVVIILFPIQYISVAVLDKPLKEYTRRNHFIHSYIK